MGSVWRSTRKTEMPFGSLKRSGCGAFKGRSAPAAGCCLRNASSSGNASSGAAASATAAGAGATAAGGGAGAGAGAGGGVLPAQAVASVRPSREGSVRVRMSVESFRGGGGHADAGLGRRRTGFPGGRGRHDDDLRALVPGQVL